MKHFFTASFILISCHIFSQSCNAPITAFVSSIAELRTTISNTINHQGEVTITIKNGTYYSSGSNMIFNVDRMNNYCTYKIKAETTGEVEFIGLQFLNFLYGTFHIDGIKFTRTQYYTKGLLRLDRCKNSFVENCTFDDDETKVDLSRYYYYIQIKRGLLNTVRSCDFEYKYTKAHAIQIRVDTTQSLQTQMNKHEIVDCHFKGQFLNESASMIAIGLHGDVATESAHIFSRILVKDNIFENYNVNLNNTSDIHSYDEIISNKSSGNRYINNTFLNCNGLLKLRAGGHCIIDGNRFIHETDKTRPRTSGIRFNGPGHQITNNYFENMNAHAIYAYCGNAPMDYYISDGETQPTYMNPDSVNIAYNTIINTNDSGSALFGIVYFGSNNNNLPKHLKFENNIMCRYGASKAKSFFQLRGSSTATPPPSRTLKDGLFNNNILYSNQPSSIQFENMDFETMQQLLTSDPLLAYTGQEYKPTANSIAANRADATNYPTVITDIDGIQRVSGKEDIGCHEFDQNGIVEQPCPDYVLDILNNNIVKDTSAVIAVVSNGKVNTGHQIEYHAGMEVELINGFEVEHMATFHAYIGNLDCIEEPSADAQIVCPEGNFVASDPTNFIVQVIHTNPASQVVKYDPRVNGEDPGPAYPYDPNNAVQIGSYDFTQNPNHFPTSGNGTLTLEMVYWYDGNTSNVLSAGTCQIYYDF